MDWVNVVITAVVVGCGLFLAGQVGRIVRTYWDMRWYNKYARKRGYKDWKEYVRSKFRVEEF